MYCKNCGEKLFEHQTVCIKCGTPVEELSQKTLQSNEPVQNQPKNQKVNGNLNGHGKGIIAILCLFLGSFGAHNFIMGENKKGIVKLVTSFFGVGFFLALFDFIRIITNNYTYNPDAFI